MHPALTLAAIAGALLASSASAQPDAVAGADRFDGDKLVRVRIRTGDDLIAMDAISPDPWVCHTPGVGFVEYRVPRTKMGALDASGIPYRVLVQDVQALLDAEAARIRAGRLEGGQPGGAWFNDYKDYAAISAYVDQLVALRPAVASRLSLGQSLLGREIFAIRIAAPGAPADKPAIFLHGLQHAREWITGATVMYIADRLVRTQPSDPAVASALNSFQFIIVPIANPDGYAYTWTNNRLWRKNRRANPNGSVGVDLNRNWGVGWGSNTGSSGSQGSDTYRGTAAFSEPETQVLRDFVAARPYIKAHFDVHSYSQLILSAYGYTPTLPPNHLLFDDLNAVMRSAFFASHGLDYTAGPTYSTIYPVSGGSTDWTFGARGILSWGFELRDTGTNGFILPPDQIIPSGEETYSAVMALAGAIGQPLRFTFPAGLPTQVQPGQATSVQVVVSSLAGTLAPASPRMLVRIGRSAEFESVPLTLVSGAEYAATLPGAPCGAELQFSFAADTVAGPSVASPAAGPAYAASATLNANCPACPADFNRDGVLDPDDLSDFIATYFAGGPGADFNADGFADPDDLADYIGAFFAGCR